MGQTLSAPVTQKHTDSGEDERYIYGVSEMQGWRVSMEDAHTTILNLNESESDKTAFFAVYDGHGGATVAQFSGKNVHKRLASEETYHKKQYEAALKKAFLGTDDDIRADPSFFHDPSGCTAVAALLTPDRKIYVANAGDSRSIISVKGQAKPLSYDHKPQNMVENSRITAAGGYIEYGRVNGNLALSRAIGDFEFKKNYSLAAERQIITADPDVIEHDMTDEDEFLVLACDGIWDCLSSQQVVDVVRRLIHNGVELPEICNELMDICLAPDSNSGGGIGCDNMTVLVVALLNGRTKEEWYAWVKDRVAQQYGYNTPENLPQIYSINRVEAARARGEHTTRPHPGNLARALVNGPITFYPGSWNSNDTGTLMFDQEDSEEEESEEEVGDSSTFFSSLRAPTPRDLTKSLKAQLDELREGMGMDGDGDQKMTETDGAADSNTRLRKLGGLQNKNLRQGEAPLPPPDFKSEEEPSQLAPLPPSGDEPSGAVKVEGLMDASESPLKTD
ncbi:PP2C-domain-containing protein [Ramaria rubella]|nr:PP2C-domain-containing protein [Ramaria rubella]